jgi:hypothetical protein
MKKRWFCAACKKSFRPNPRAKNQRFCSKDSCQKERRRREQQERRRRDPAYRENEQRAEERRKQKNPHYSRDYRRKHPEAAERNRLGQRERDRRRRGREVVPGPAEVLAPEASMTVEISVISDT